MNNKRNKSQIEGLVVLVLFGVFAVSILAVLLTGAGTYKRLVSQQQSMYARRTVPQYIATKVRQNDLQGAVRVAEFGGVESLELVEWLEGEEYITRIYCYDGYVRELFSAATGNFEPADGQQILEAEQIAFALQDGYLEVAVTSTDGEKSECKLMLRSAKGGNRE